jgi:hypothetical protein
MKNAYQDIAYKQRKLSPPPQMKPERLQAECDRQDFFNSFISNQNYLDSLS